MPEMPLLYRGKPLPASGVRDVLNGVMAFPDDVRCIASYAALSCVPHSKLTEQIISKVENRGKGGSIAGAIFLHLLALKIQCPQKASIQKATHVIAEYLKGSGERAPKHIDRVHACWGEYQSAAHLWAAYLMLREKYRMKSVSVTASESRISSEANRNIELEDSLEGLDLSELILQLGEDLFSKAMELGLTFKKDFWRLPEGYPRAEVQIDISELPDCVLDFLKSYKAPSRSHSKFEFDC